MAHGVPGYLGPYRLLNVVHTGHASVIWQAYDDANQRMVGVKTLLAEGRDREQLNFLRREFVVGKAISDPHIIEIYAFDWDRSQPYLSMEWFSASNMKLWILQGWGDLTPMLPKIVEQAAVALACFHRAGWVHRDVKPDNFLVGADGMVKLIDFALAVRIKKGLARIFSSRSKIQGTKSYMSPEQIRGTVVDQRSDLYSFACMLFEIVSGKPPFTGVSVNDLLTKHLRSTPPSLEAANQHITPEFAQLVKKCLSKKPAARPETVDDFLREFRMIRMFRGAPNVG